ncbi:MYXO-CTERM sorting domain-containing protein [Polyangium sp. y55x31]|uniref:MYXO-CTERM sorting domain-containing protein n=1 Tax=Polyangium sp. y55x31 TaxID=3042688 RepID=UPI002482B45F|nr:MYXO-CTERM sorting domain-containing protein [Polyangium sp. y55x31]MDI1483653.1 MYXO-CTERM sorting domain-containing protein [Polyangium sp. y55x31]
MRSPVLLFVATVLLASAPASADVLSEPPQNCPEGSLGQLCHGPPRCAPLPCTSDADCQGGGTCKVKELCIEDINCSGGWIDAPPVTHVAGTCDATGACPMGGTCKKTLVCVGGSISPTSGSGAGTGAGSGAGAGDGGGDDDIAVKGCACSAVGDHAAPWLGLAMVAVGAGIAVARRRRPH